MDNFELIEKIGNGSFCAVYKANNKRTGKACALKVYKAHPDDNHSNLLTEALILSRLDHPNIVACHGVLFDKNRILFHLELVSSDLHTLLAKNHCFVKKSYRAIMWDILSGLKYLHSKDIIHCDLKPENILFEEKKETYKITDFNSAKVGKISKTAGCTKWYMPPEGIDDVYVKTGDVWSAGCILYELITGNVLFPADSETEYMRMISTMGTMNCPLEKIEDKMALDLIRKMLHTNPEQRITTKEALEHLFFAQ